MTCAVYRLYDHSGNLLYVGMTGNFKGQRLGWHRGQQPWRAEIDTYIVREYPSRSKARAVEKRAIDILRPRHNRGSKRDPRPVFHRPFLNADELLEVSQTCKHRWAISATIGWRKCLRCGSWEYACQAEAPDSKINSLETVRRWRREGYPGLEDD